MKEITAAVSQLWKQLWCKHEWGKMHIFHNFAKDRSERWKFCDLCQKPKRVSDEKEGE